MRPVVFLMAGGAVALLAGVLALFPGRTPEGVAGVAAAQQAKPGAAPSAATTARRSAPSGTITVVATGDIVMGSTPNLPPDGGRTFFDAVRSKLGGDVVLGNLEGTLSVGGASKCGAGSSNCYAFQTPPSYAAWLRKAGFTVMNVANNHAYDFGASGQQQTLAALKKQRLLWTGRPGQITYQRIGDVEVALLGFAPYSWAQSLTDIPAAKRLVKQAAANADVVIVTMHAGAEGSDRQHVRPGTEIFLGENRGDPMAFARAVVDAGADAVIGHGPHVLRGMEWYKGRLIAYSLGNFAGYRVFALGGPLSISGILRLTLNADGTFVRGTLVPTMLAGAGVPGLDPAESAHGIVRTLSREDFGARAVKVATSGALSR